MATGSLVLTGNPNTGKSTIFNALTGSRQKIGNWPGVTVDKKTGWVNYEDRLISVVDLPGTYSVNSRSPEEKIVIDYLKEEHPDFVINVIDTCNMERNLFLTVQLLEQGIPLVIDLNMADEAKAKGFKVNIRALEETLGMPVIETVGRDMSSVKRLLDLFTSVEMSAYEPSAILREHIARADAIMADGKGNETERIAELRYDFIDTVIKRVVKRGAVSTQLGEKIDGILANGFFALPILLAMIYGVFELTFTWIGQPLADMLKMAISERFTPWIAQILETAGVLTWIRSLIVDGIIGGVGGVIVFVPLIFTLFFCLSFLDGTGYMARVAFVMDPVMRRAGLSGKGIMPLIMGFGCGVPAVMGARALDSEKDRMILILITPFLTCGAKLPVMALFAAVFFPKYSADVVFAMYVIGVLVAILMSKVLNATMFKDEEATFLLELPPYRMPDMRSVFIETWDKGKEYLVKAGTVIFTMSVLIWLLSNFNFSGHTADMSESFLAQIGLIMSKMFVFHGFASWETGAALVTGILAKESVVSTMAILYGAGEVSAEVANQLTGTISTAFSVASAISFMVFIQLYTPCITVLGTIRKETGRWKWVLFAAVYTFATAWIISLAVYRGALAFFG